MDLRHDKRPICEASCAVKVMEISVETEDAVNPKVPHMGKQCHPYFSAKRIPSSPSWLRRCSVCSAGDSVLRPLILKLGLSENAGVPKPLGLKLETSFPP